MASTLRDTRHPDPSTAGTSRVSQVSPVSCASSATDSPSLETSTTMAADFKRVTSHDLRDRAASSQNTAVAPSISLWEYDDPTPGWAAPLRETAQAWVERYGVNTATLIRVDGECTRFALLELDGHRFIVGPTATPSEAHSLTHMLKTTPQIGAIFCVEPGTMQRPRERDGGASDGAGYRERPVGDYIARVTRRGGRRSAPGAQGHDAGMLPCVTSGRLHLDGGLSHVQFMEFTGMERFDTPIDGAALWRAGKGVAGFMRAHPGKIPLVCSERGIARPCAVIASAALQLRGGDARLRSLLAHEVVRQRAEASDHHINVAARSFDLIAELSRLTTMLREPGRGDTRSERKVHILRQQLMGKDLGVRIDWQSGEGRRRLADYLEANFEKVSPLLASGGLPPGTAMLWLRDELDVLNGIRFLSPAYVDGHTDRISQEAIAVNDPNAVRLVSFDDYGLTCDNKYYDVSSVTGWYRHCLGASKPLSNPVSRAPVVALLVRASEKARLEAQFRRWQV
ncbi:hypothetical protein MB84_22845 [Pandoraea oxalativorans]|uniref:Uncharacterized protein n=1 Tax=Pandoraea oxalativorans TaxID=573737 RepID=A0A0E3YGC2_9BURK|nr:hypothetical protein MB84_22845 [Pandoraea oxalativorans]